MAKPGRQLIPGFDETRVLRQEEKLNQQEKERARMQKVKRIVKLLSKRAAMEDTEYAPGGKKPYPEGSGPDKKNTRSGIDEAWESHETFAPGSGDPEPTRMNNSSESSI